jgi:hypothetical protein
MVLAIGALAKFDAAAALILAGTEHQRWPTEISL